MRSETKKRADAKAQKNIYANLKIRKEILAKLEEYAARNGGIDKQAALLKLLN